MTTTKNDTEITIRRLGTGDREALERLAQLDSSAAPQAPLLGAEMDGRLLAAASIESGDIVADPFVRTDELRSLLEVRISQLKGKRRSRRRFPRSRSRAALAGSPPGAGGKLITLPVRLG